MDGNVIPLTIKPIQDKGYHCFVNLYYSRLPIPMVLDTGASRTVLDTAAIERLDLAHQTYQSNDEAVGFTNNGIKAQFLDFPLLSIGQIKLKHLNLGVLDLSHINNTYKDLSIAPVSGILGNDLLVDLKAKIDFGRSQMRVWPPKAN
jgi:hypothetical protein